MSRTNQQVAEINLYDRFGRRKYLTPRERGRFKAHADTLPARERTFCLMFYFTGLRISEALELTPHRLDYVESVVIIRTLKRRKDSVFRALPLPRHYMYTLKRLNAGESSQGRIWSFSRKTGYRIIKAALTEAGISGVHASPKGLRHGFGIVSAQRNVPLPLISKWMGHSSLRTTAIYLNAVGPEERQFARRIW